MHTAIISDLHLGASSGTDLLRDRAIAAVLLEELTGADRVVLLGDVLELRDRPLGEIVELASPFFSGLADATGDAEILFVPGNHDHRLAEPLLERRSLGRPRALSLEHRFAPSTGASAALARRVGGRRLTLAYPGVWLREDAYATHGHYLDCHLLVPRLEALGVAAVLRPSGGIPDPAIPDDYERAVGPVYGLTFGLAQSKVAARSVGRDQLATAWKRLYSGQNRGSLRERALGSVAFPLTVRMLARVLDRPFSPDISPEAIARAGLAAMRETVRHLRLDAPHLLYGHTHTPGAIGAAEGGAADGEQVLHNTGTWAYAVAPCATPSGATLFWPGTVTWLDESGPPERRELLASRSRDELVATVRELRAWERARAARP